MIDASRDSGKPSHQTHFISKPVGTPWTDGSVKLVGELVAALSEEMTSNERYTLFAKPGYRSPHTAVVTRHLALGGALRNIELAIRVLRSDRRDVLHFFFAPHPLAVEVSRYVSRMTGAASVQTICSRPRSFENAASLCFGDQVIVLSRWTRDRLIAAGGESEMTHVIPPPLAPVPHPTAERLRKVRKLLRLESGRKVVLFPGDAERGGGLRPFVEAIAALVKERRDVLFIVACRPKTKEAARELSRATGRLDELGFGEFFRIVGRFHDFHALLAATDICVLPATTLYAKVDYPYALLEAMSLGVPVIVGDGTAAVELIEQGGGLVVPRRGSLALAACLVSLLEDEPRRRELGEQARLTVETLCRPSTVADQYRSVYHQLYRERA